MGSSVRHCVHWNLASAVVILSLAMFTLLGRGALSLAVLSLLTSSVAGEVLEKLRAVPEGVLFLP